MVLEIKNELLQNSTMAVIFPVVDYPNQINEVVKILGENYGKVLYVSLNRLYNPLKRKMQMDGVDISKFIFVDCATKTAVANPPEAQDCIYVSSPDALTEMSIAITKSIQNSYPDLILFDSLSTLLIYENPNVATQFIHSLTNKMNSFGIKIVFTVLDGEKEKPLISNLNMLMDKVIRT
ncbi:hypothetical protein C0585_05910 [Candidatus Woesearchaeota archaeon]|nr:MAG: hypothetical protein C0585_05910 [Candidatus Woesearchaeota archaeon]